MGGDNRLTQWHGCILQNLFFFLCTAVSREFPVILYHGNIPSWVNVFTSHTVDCDTAIVKTRFCKSLQYSMAKNYMGLLRLLLLTSQPVPEASLEATLCFRFSKYIAMNAISSLAWGVLTRSTKSLNHDVANSRE